ncbi:MAG: hypothetical protein JJE25_14600 [Bacteroidia bacterium]|nr:hypothetical protein [Bacteroidia bacterium]
MIGLLPPDFHLLPPNFRFLLPDFNLLPPSFGLLQPAFNLLQPNSHLLPPLLHLPAPNFSLPPPTHKEQSQTKDVGKPKEKGDAVLPAPCFVWGRGGLVGEGGNTLCFPLSSIKNI